jgi:hypothetical protein
MYIKKWIKGKPIRTANQAIELILNHQVIFHNHKPYTYGWTQNWSIIAIRMYVKNGLLFTAKENKCLPI